MQSNYVAGLAVVAIAALTYSVATFTDAEASVRVWALIGLGVVSIASLIAFVTTPPPKP